MISKSGTLNSTTSGISQHHAGQLIDRLRLRESIGIDWVGMKPPSER